MSKDGNTVSTTGEKWMYENEASIAGTWAYYGVDVHLVSRASESAHIQPSLGWSWCLVLDPIVSSSSQFC